MSRLTTYFRGTDGFAIGTSGEVIGRAFQTASIYGSNSSAYPLSLLNACDGGIPVLLKNVVFNNRGAAYSAATVWSRMPVNSFVTSVRVQVSGGSLSAGIFSTYWQAANQSTQNTFTWQPPTGAFTTQPSLPTNANASTYLAVSNNSNIGLRLPILRFDIQSLSGGFTGTINCWLEYVIIPPDDV